MTRSYKPDMPLSRKAEELLESLTGSILQEAHQAAANRRDKMSEVSPTDIIEGLEARHYRIRQRDRAVFAGQIFGTAVAVSGVVIAFSATVLSLGDGSSSAAVPAHTESTTLFVTVLLALLLVVGSTLLVFVVRHVLVGKLDAKRISRTRYQDEAALVQEWAMFEDAMRRDLRTQGDRGLGSNLSTLISQFAQLYGVDVGEVKKILRMRNSVVHGLSKVPISDVRASLEKLRLLMKTLRISDY